MEQVQPIFGTLVDLPALSANFPPAPTPELARDNVVNTIQNLLDELHGLAVEGPEGMGKSTVLAQFVRAHPATAISVFISAANRLSSDPDLIRMDIARQVYWLLTNDILQTGQYDPALLKSYYSDLHREARRRKCLFYFVVDGLEELSEAERQSLLQHFVDILPTGNHQFRFLMSGDLAYFGSLINKPFEAKSYPLTEFGIEETSSFFAGESVTAKQQKEIRALCVGSPGRMASIARSIRFGTDIQRVIDEIPTSRPEFFSIDWKQVPDADEDLKRILAVLTLDAKPYTPQIIGEILRVDTAVVDQKLKGLNFISYDKDTGNVHFASTGLRQFIGGKLAERKKQVQALLIKRLSDAPSSSESLMDLPEYLEDAAQFQTLLTLLTPNHIVAVLERSQTLSKVEDIVNRGFRTARRLGRDNDLLRFGIQNAVIREFALSSVWISEVEALAALGRNEEALALANNATLQEDRLQLLAAFAKGSWLRVGKIDRELSEQIKLLIERADPRSIGRRVSEIAEHLVCASPDLATALLERVTPALPDDSDLDRLFLSLSARAVSSLKDDRLRDEVMERFTIKSPSSKVKSSLKSLRVLTSRLTAKQVIADIESMELPEAKIRVLRAWCVINADQKEAHIVAEYALHLAIRTTAYTLDSSLLADLSSPLPGTPDPIHRRALINSFDGLRGTAERLGPSIDYVRLQLYLTSAEFDSEQIAAESRLIELFDYVVAIQDLPSRGEAFARLLVTLDRFAAKHYLSFGPSLENECLNQLETVVLLLIVSTADQFTAITGIIGALARGFLDKALDYASMANTENRRDALACDIVESLIARPTAEIKPSELLQTLAVIKQRSELDRALDTIMERFAEEGNLSVEFLNALSPIISRLGDMQDSVIACRALVKALNLLNSCPSASHDLLRKEVANQLYTRWSLIDVGWLRIDAGFGIARDLASTSAAEAERFLLETETLKDSSNITANRPAYAYVACIRLVIHAFSGLLPKRQEVETDIQSLAALIDVLPSYGERAVLWSDACMRCSISGRQDLAERISRDFLKPILDKISLADTAYRAQVLISTGPALYRVGPTACLERLNTLDADSRDIALLEIIGFLIRGRVPTDPRDDSAVPDNETPYDALVEAASLTTRIETDWMIYTVARDIAKLFRSTRKHYLVNLPQREDIASRFTAIANNQLPARRHIQHNGYRIITLSQCLLMKESRKESEWSPVIADARAMENVADRAFVLETVALCLPSSMVAQRDQLIGEARAIVCQIPSELDQIERYIGFAEDLNTIDKKLCRELIASAAAVLGHASEDVAAQRKRLVDVAFRVEEPLASALIDKFDGDLAKRIAREQLKLLKVQKEITDAEPEKAVSQVRPRELKQFGWSMLKALNSGRIQHFHPSSVRNYLEVAGSQRLKRAFPILLWYVENAVARFSKTEQAAGFLRPIFDATVVGAQLAGEIAGQTLTRLRAAKKRSGEFGGSHSLLVTPGSREDAMKTIASWCERNLGDFVKIADPYFAPQDLEWIQLLRTSKPSCEITIMTGRRNQPAPPPGEELEDLYINTWRKMFDQNPPRAKIVIIGGERGKQSPIHDRWLVTSAAGLRFGTSLNSLGITKDSEVSEMSVYDAEEKSTLINQYLNMERAEHDGEKLRLTSFWL